MQTKPTTQHTDPAQRSASNLGQMHEPRYAVIINAGLADEDIWSKHMTYESALRELKNNGGRENGFDIARLTDATHYTYEF